MHFDDRGIFIVGCQRSGTTLLRVILDSHPLLCSADESGFLIDMERLFNNRWNHVKTFGLTKAEVLEEIKKFFLVFHHSYCSKVGKERWVDKSPQYVKILPFVAKIFPSCKIIHIIRDGRDVAASFRDKWGSKGFFTSLYEWPRCVRKGRLDGVRLSEKQYFEIRYEYLVRNPKEAISRVLDFLEVEWNDAVLTHYSRAHVTTNYNGWDRPLKPIFQKSVGSYKNRLHWYEKTLASLAFRSLLQQLDYHQGPKYPLKRRSTLEKGLGGLGFIISRILLIWEKIGNGSRSKT